jgi:hypothetical protein
VEKLVSKKVGTVRAPGTHVPTIAQPIATNILGAPITSPTIQLFVTLAGIWGKMEGEWLLTQRTEECVGSQVGRRMGSQATLITAVGTVFSRWAVSKANIFTSAVLVLPTSLAGRQIWLELKVGLLTGSGGLGQAWGQVAPTAFAGQANSR